MNYYFGTGYPDLRSGLQDVTTRIIPNLQWPPLEFLVPTCRYNKCE